VVELPAEPEPIPAPREFMYEQHGDVCLTDKCAIWKIPVELPAWARALMPVVAKRLPDLVLPEKKTVKTLTRQLANAQAEQPRSQVLEARCVLGRFAKVSRIPRYGVYQLTAET